jgi:hypothetical protein
MKLLQPASMPVRGFGFAEFALRANSWASLGEFGARPQTPKTKTRSVLVPLARAKAFGFRLGSFAKQNSGKLSRFWFYILNSLPR